MFHSRTLNKRINKIHERALRLAYKNETFLSFDDLLKRDKSLSIHQKNLQILATEICKTKNDLGPKIMKDTSHFIQKPYNLRNKFWTIDKRSVQILEKVYWYCGKHLKVF